jgi:two-component system chemotaxis response regulator CheB
MAASSSRDIVVLGGSSGALPALLELLREVPRDLPAALFVVIHTSADNPGVLPEILQRTTELAVGIATQDAPVEHGRIYVAKPDHHLRLAKGRMTLDRGPRENGFRPAVDPLFLSAAQEYGRRVIGILLSGGLDDGTLGLMRIKRADGIALVQAPEDSLVPSMPMHAIERVDVDLVAAASVLGTSLASFVTGGEKGGLRMKKKSRSRAGSAPEAVDLPNDLDGPAPPELDLTCPDCGGALRRVEESGLARYGCHVGHQYTELGLLDGQRAEVESALWSAVRALREQAALRRRMSLRAHDRGWSTIAESYEAESRDAERRAELLRDLLASAPPEQPEEIEPPASGASRATSPGASHATSPGASHATSPGPALPRSGAGRNGPGKRREDARRRGSRGR